MIFLTTNHKVGDAVYVVGDCVRRGVIQQVNFAQTASAFTLSYQVLYDGYRFTTTVNSAVDANVSGVGSPYAVGSPVTGSPLVGSPAPGGVGSPEQYNIAVTEVANGGGIYVDKSAALTAFGETLA